MMPGLPDDWMDDGRPVCEHIAEAVELAARRCRWWWQRWLCKQSCERTEGGGWRCLTCGRDRS